ncbi:MAG: hypothetical protein HY709_11055 [Candidatus Latescibacteria bacterium]|nr:hypothetical protein [Candidatus Latescibacterota bacterium]
MLSERENWLRTVEFRYPEWIPCSVGFSPINWNAYREDLEKIVLSHPRLFPGYQEGSANFFDEMPPVYREGEYFRDNWGCLWYNIQGGIEGQVVEHPLDSWDALDTYRLPDSFYTSERGERDWEAIREGVKERKSRGELTGGDGERLFDRLYFLRGFENLMVDIATDDPHLPRLIEMLTEYELKLVNRWLEIGVDVMSFHTDIGSQKALMISPEKFRQYIKPMYRELFQTCRKAGAHVALSSDGCLLEIVDDLIECGVSLHDPQLRACTLKGIAKAYKGKLCAKVDLDRQSFAFLTPKELRKQIKDVVDVMGAPEGGLMVMGSVYGAEVPLENVEAICEAMEDYCLK